MYHCVHIPPSAPLDVWIPSQYAGEPCYYTSNKSSKVDYNPKYYTHYREPHNVVRSEKKNPTPQLKTEKSKIKKFAQKILCMADNSPNS